jgi:hypothetical protein
VSFKTRVVFLFVTWVLLLVLALTLLTAMTSFFSSDTVSRDISSLSWAGYVVTRNALGSEQGFVGVNASWTVPQLNVSSGNGYSSAWVGIGGQLDRTLIQVGTEHDVIDGHQSYSAWYEMLPGFAVTLPDLTISPGDTIVASLSLTNPSINQWDIQIIDQSTAKSFSTNVFYNSTLSSAECVIERPTVSNQISPMANFGSVTFSGCNLWVSNGSAPLGNYAYYIVNMYNGQNSRLASVSPLTDDGAGFSIQYLMGK